MKIHVYIKKDNETTEVFNYEADAFYEVAPFQMALKYFLVEVEDLYYENSRQGLELRLSKRLDENQLTKLKELVLNSQNKNEIQLLKIISSNEFIAKETDLKPTIKAFQLEYSICQDIASTLEEYEFDEIIIKRF